MQRIEWKNFEDSCRRFKIFFRRLFYLNRHLRKVIFFNKIKSANSKKKLSRRIYNNPRNWVNCWCYSKKSRKNKGWVETWPSPRINLRVFCGNRTWPDLFGGTQGYQRWTLVGLAQSHYLRTSKFRARDPACSKKGPKTRTMPKKGPDPALEKTDSICAVLAWASLFLSKSLKEIYGYYCLDIYWNWMKFVTNKACCCVWTTHSRCQSPKFENGI